VTQPGPAGARSSVTLLPAGSWLSPGDDALQQMPPEMASNHCSPSPVIAVVYFCTFVLLCGLVMVNFVIGVIIDNMQSSSENADLPVNKAHMERFAQVNMPVLTHRMQRCAGGGPVWWRAGVLALCFH